MNTTSRSWCFTLQVPEQFARNQETALRFAEEFYAHDEKEAGHVRYVIYQLERGEQQQRFHLQGYVELSASQRRSYVRRLISDSAHWEPRRGTRDEARNYCRKEDTRIAGPWEFGVWNTNGRGNRSDLATLAGNIQSGQITFANVREEHPARYVQYRNGVRDLLAHSARQRTRQFRNVHVTVLCGPPGCGKSRYAVGATHDYFMLDPGSNGTNVWFDGYEGQSTLIIDDFYGWIRWTMLLRLLDGYQCRLPVKGGFVYAEYTRVFITSNSHPAEWYDYGRHMNWGALRRRVSELRMWEGDNEEPTVGLLPIQPLPWAIEPHEIIEIE